MSDYPLDRIQWNHGRDTVDEIVVQNCTFHLEQMTDTSYWIGVTRGSPALAINLYHRGRLPLLCTVEDDSDPGSPWVWDYESEC